MNEDSGELELKEYYFKQITWKVHNASSLLENVCYIFQSPSFLFADATWKLLMYPNGQTAYESRGYISLLIERLDSLTPEHYVLLKFCFKSDNGKELLSYSDYVLFTSRDLKRRGVHTFFSKSFLMEEKNIYAPNDVLTITCEMRIDKIPALDKNSLIGSATSLSDSAATSDLPLPFNDNKLSRDFKEFFLKQESCDVLIKVKGVEFNAHRAIVSARSPVFASTFRNDMKEKATGVIDIEDCDPSTFTDFLCFLYCGEIDSLSFENVFSLFTAADKYDVSDLRAKCLDFVKENLSVDTFCETITLALQHCETDLIKLATEFFTKNMPAIVVTVKWQSFLVDNPIQSNELIIKAVVPKNDKHL